MRKLMVLSAGAALLAAALPAAAELGLNMPKGVTPFSRDVYDLHMLILWICVIIGVVVFGAMFVSMFLHRKSRGHEPAQFSHSLCPGCLDAYYEEHFDHETAGT